MPVLQEIIAVTRVAVTARRRTSELRALEAAAASHVPRRFADALRSRAAEGVAVIAELKKASPSKGLLRANMDVAKIAREYEAAGAAALSVLTEEHYFQGSLENLRIASESTKLPCLRKDFIIDEFQVLEARANRADAILLIVASLSDSELRTLSRSAKSFELDVLCEVHDKEELERAVACGCEIIGVNNRNLKTFDVDLATAERLAPQIPASALKVAESGIHMSADIARLSSSGFKVFLVGESLITQPSPGEALRRLLAPVRTETAIAGELRAKS